MNNSPKIYVIMPVYNCEKFIFNAVSSIINQSYQNIEILIVNDGSTDNTPSLCNKLCKENDAIKVLHTQNGGVSSARNKGIDYILNNFEIDNSYIAFCDADDLWAKDCLKQEFSEYFDQDIIAFQSCYISYDASRCSAPHGNCHSINVDKGGRKAIWKYPFHFGAFLYKTELFKRYNIRFDTDLKYNEDKVLLMQLLFLADSIRQIPQMMYLYRKNPASAMHNRPRGINYYLPLINGWMRSDDKMKEYANAERGTLTAGYALANIYVIEMAKEHYGWFGKQEILYKTIKEHPIYPYFCNLDPLDVSEKQYSEHCSFNKHPKSFQIKHTLIGVFARILKRITKISFIANYLYSREFSSENIYL